MTKRINPQDPDWYRSSQFFFFRCKVALMVEISFLTSVVDFLFMLGTFLMDGGGPDKITAADKTPILI